MKKTIGFLNIIIAALVAGTVFGIWIGYNPKDLSATAYIEQQQSAINALNTLMPLLGLLTILLTFFSAYLHKKEKSIFITLLVAVVFLIVSGVTTRFGNQPINSIVMSWNASSPPANWVELRDEWWSFHILRTFTSVVGLCLIVWVNLKKE